MDAVPNLKGVIHTTQLNIWNKKNTQNERYMITDNYAFSSKEPQKMCLCVSE